MVMMTKRTPETAPDAIVAFGLLLLLPDYSFGM